MVDDFEVIIMHVDRKIGVGCLQRGDCADVVKMGMGKENGLEGQPSFAQEFDDAISLLPGIDDPCLAVLAQDRAVDFESADLNGFSPLWEEVYQISDFAQNPAAFLLYYSLV